MASAQLEVQMGRLHLGNTRLLACPECNTALVYENDYSALFINTMASTTNRTHLFARVYNVHDSDRFELMTHVDDDNFLVCRSCDKIVGENIYLPFGDGQFQKVVHTVNEIITLRNYPEP